MRVAFIGLGLMGSRMAMNLIAKEFDVSVYNRTKSRTEPLRARGAFVASSPAEAAQRSEVICTCVADPKAMDDVFLGESGIASALSAGKTMIDFSNALAGSHAGAGEGVCRAWRRVPRIAGDGVEGRRGGGDAGAHVRRKPGDVRRHAPGPVRRRKESHLHRTGR